jgi:HK97 family phage prohead protease
MKIQIREDSVTIEGYVNAVERASKPLNSRLGKFVEKICAGAFKRALGRAEDVRILLNHDWSKDLGGIKDGNLELEEDNIGLHARATITDPEVIKDARNGDLVGWSFGFDDREVENSRDEETGLPFRKVKDLDLAEVSLLNRRKSPAYVGTLVNVRDDGSTIYCSEDNITENIETIDETANKLDETTAEAIAEIRAEDPQAKAQDPETTPANDVIKSYDNSRYKNIIAELKTMRDSVKN